MSLDVYLNLPSAKRQTAGSGIFVRENGRILEISEEEWFRRNPDREPVRAVAEEGNGEVYSANITHNLSQMARLAGIYSALWHPEELGITKAIQLLSPLANGLAALRADPDRFKAFNPSNKWGNYEGFVEFVSEFLEACIAYPEATVSVWR